MIRVTVHGIKELQAKTRAGLPKAAVDEFFLKAALMVKANAMSELRNGPAQAYDTGNLARSLTTQIAGFSASVGTNAPYAMAVHNGARPHNPPPEPIYAWAARHGIPKEAWFPVYRAIARRGAKARPFLANALRTFAAEQAAALLAKLARDIEAHWKSA